MDLETKFDLILKELKNICNQIDERFEEVDNRLDSLSGEVGALHRTLFKLDVDTQEKLSTLFEADKIHNDKDLLFEKLLYKLYDSIDNTTYRVSILEDNTVNS